MSDAPPVSSYLFVGTHGHVLALDKQTGSTVWTCSLPSTGYAVVAVLYEEGRLFCASGGRAFALDPADGSILWQNSLPGMGRGEVFISTAQSNNTEGLLAILAREADQRRQQAAASSGAAGVF